MIKRIFIYFYISLNFFFTRIEELLFLFNKSNNAFLTFLYFSLAFHTVDHSIAVQRFNIIKMTQFNIINC